MPWSANGSHVVGRSGLVNISVRRFTYPIIHEAVAEPHGVFTFWENHLRSVAYSKLRSEEVVALSALRPSSRGCVLQPTRYDAVESLYRRPVYLDVVAVEKRDGVVETKGGV